MAAFQETLRFPNIQSRAAPAGRNVIIKKVWNGVERSVLGGAVARLLLALAINAGHVLARVCLELCI